CRRRRLRVRLPARGAGRAARAARVASRRVRCERSGGSGGTRRGLEATLSGLILVTGGAGYIGSHTVLALRDRGREVLVVDDLSEGHEAALLGARLARGSLLDREFVRRVFADHDITA